MLRAAWQMQDLGCNMFIQTLFWLPNPHPVTSSHKSRLTFLRLGGSQPKPSGGHWYPRRLAPSFKIHGSRVVHTRKLTAGTQKTGGLGRCFSFSSWGYFHVPAPAVSFGGWAPYPSARLGHHQIWQTVPARCM